MTLMARLFPTPEPIQAILDDPQIVEELNAALEWQRSKAAGQTVEDPLRAASGGAVGGADNPGGGKASGDSGGAVLGAVLNTLGYFRD